MPLRHPVIFFVKTTKFDMTIITKERSPMKVIILSEVNFFFAVIESEFAIEKDMHSMPVRNTILLIC